MWGHWKRQRRRKSVGALPVTIYHFGNYGGEPDLFSRLSSPPTLRVAMSPHPSDSDLQQATKFTETPTAKWSYFSRSPALARSSHSLVFDGGVIYLFGGEQSPRQPVDAEPQLIGALHWLNTSEKNPAWNLSSAMRQRRSSSSSGADDNREVVPAPRVGAAATLDGKTMYLWGGRGGKDMDPLDKHQAGFWKVKVGEVCLTWERVKAVNEEDAPESRSYHSMVSIQVSAFREYAILRD
jgi:hypothetical protein